MAKKSKKRSRPSRASVSPTLAYKVITAYNSGRYTNKEIAKKYMISVYTVNGIIGRSIQGYTW